MGCCGEEIRDESQSAREVLLTAQFVKGLRAGLEAGLTPTQLLAVVGIADGLRGMSTEFDEGELAGRSDEVMRVMQGLIAREKKPAKKKVRRK